MWPIKIEVEDDALSTKRRKTAGSPAKEMICVKVVRPTLVIMHYKLLTILKESALTVMWLQRQPNRINGSHTYVYI
jgi:hypothetical protein